MTWLGQSKGVAWEPKYWMPIDEQKDAHKGKKKKKPSSSASNSDFDSSSLEEAPKKKKGKTKT